MKTKHSLVDITRTYPTCRKGRDSEGYWHTLENVKIDWVYDGASNSSDLGAIFYYPEDAPPRPKERVKTVSYRGEGGLMMRFVTRYESVPSGARSPIEKWVHPSLSPKDDFH